MRVQAGQAHGRRSDGEWEVPLPGRLKRINKGLFTQERGADGARRRPEKVWTPGQPDQEGTTRGGGGPGSMCLGSGSAGVWTGHGGTGAGRGGETGEAVGGGEDMFSRVLPSPDVSPGPHSREAAGRRGAPAGWAAGAEQSVRGTSLQVHRSLPSQGYVSSRCPASAARAVGAGTAGTSPWGPGRTLDTGTGRGALPSAAHLPGWW